MINDGFSIAIIGVGPRGFSIIERLHTNIQEASYSGKFEIHIGCFCPSPEKVE